jgi:hypothetical protein
VGASTNGLVAEWLPSASAIRIASALGRSADAIVRGMSRRRNVASTFPVTIASAMLTAYSVASRHSRILLGMIDTLSM